ncbi:methyl-accepting chemotaxis protein [Haloarcula onubensis]|uniref:Methyl-accepting chemotaxis protein n=1 Tax=Haloarcula onubensis TaxID=2950539 RepID=A0ABU2FMC9_9EURY|nr:methyl-accepting chemotaxis protein [Halomicroarcula sp. S3CR25-11]MDS0281923.1 methyl-accepting chemotaxis protein [Halomicroarcula sp. S3CR25-11]
MVGETDDPGGESAVGARDADTDDLPPELDELRTVMDACANGDFTRRVAVEGDDEAIAALAASFNEMLDEVERQTGQVQGLATVLTEASADVAAGAETVRDASATAGGQTEDIAVNTAEQKQRLETVAVEMEALSASIEEISASATTVADTAAETLQRGTEGQSAAKEALEEVDRIRETTDATAAKTAELEGQVQKVGDIVDLISDVADQTNLLALNAKIEAARAGEAGAGFAVVANNVQELSEEAMTAADRIAEMVDEIEAQTDDAVSDMDRMQSSVEAGAETIETALAALTDITTHIEETNHGIQEIDSAAKQQADAAQRIFSSVDDVTALSDAVKEQSASVADAVEAQADATESVTESSARLTQYADMLESAVDAHETAESISTRARERALEEARQRQTDASSSSADRSADIAMGTVADLDNSYWLSWAKGYRNAADAFGYRTDVKANDGDVAKQRRQFEAAIESGVDAIVGQTYTNESSVEFSERCVDAGVPTVLGVTIADWYTPHDAGEEYVQYIAPHFVNHAYTAATVLFEEMGGQGRFVHVEGNPGTAVNFGRNRGVELALGEYPGIELLGERRAGHFVKQSAVDVMTELVRRHGPEIDGFFAQNLSMAEGGLSVLKDAGHDVPIATIDASEQGLARVLNGDITATVSGMAPWQAAWSLAKVHDYRNGHTLDPGERMMTFNAPLCVKDPAKWRDVVDRVPVVDAETYKHELFDGETPYDWKRMSVVEAGDEWDPQIAMQPIREAELSELLGWERSEKPADYSLPAVFGDDRRLDAVERTYARQFRHDPLDS